MDPKYQPYAPLGSRAAPHPRGRASPPASQGLRGPKGSNSSAAEATVPLSNLDHRLLLTGKDREPKGHPGTDKGGFEDGTALTGPEKTVRTHRDSSELPSICGRPQTSTSPSTSPLNLRPVCSDAHRASPLGCPMGFSE